MMRYTFHMIKFCKFRLISVVIIKKYNIRFESSYVALSDFMKFLEYLDAIYFLSVPLLQLRNSNRSRKSLLVAYKSIQVSIRICGLLNHELYTEVIHVCLKNEVKKGTIKKQMISSFI